MAPRVTPVYFTDENTLGLGKLLQRSGRQDVVYPGHEDLPEIPRGTDDLDWLPIVGDRPYIVVSRERRIRSRPAELRAYHEHGVRSVWIGAKQDLGPPQQLELFLKHEGRLQREVVKRGPGPWATRDEPLRPSTAKAAAEPGRGRDQGRQVTRTRARLSTAKRSDSRGRDFDAPHRTLDPGRWAARRSRALD